MAFVTKGSAGKRAPRDAEIESLGGTVRLLPMTAGRQFELEGLCPTRSNGGFQDPAQWMGLMIADTVAGEDNERLYTPADIAAVDARAFWELWNVVSDYLGLRGAAKN